MRKSIEYHKNYDGYWSFALNLATPYELDHGEKPYNTLNISLFTHSWWFKLPEFIKPKEKWVDTTDMSWNEGKEGPHGFTDYIRKEYGVTFSNEAVHIHYGIQPGGWSRDDPENSDHTKLFWYPWNLEIVRHDLLFPDGRLYWRNKYPKSKGGRKHLHWYEVFDMDPAPEQTSQIAEFVELEHYNKTNGKLQKARIRLTGEEREWRPKWTRWLPIFKYVRRVVDCNSDTELGTRAGSWKGGMMGWSCEWRKDESMQDAFRRWYKNWDGN